MDEPHIKAYLSGVIVRLEDVPSNPPDVTDPPLTLLRGRTASIYGDHFSSKTKCCLTHALTYETIAAKYDHLTNARYQLVPCSFGIGSPKLVLGDHF